MKTALLVIAQNGYQDVELAGTQNALLAAGFEVTLASKEEGPCIGKFGGTEEALLAMRDVDPLAYDVVAFIGGPGAHALADDPEAVVLAKTRADGGKLLGAICVAPTILAAAGVLEGRNATVWDDGTGTQERFLIDRGASYTGETVTVDGRIVTANGPDAAEDFGRTLAEMA
jgi:protease I